MKKITLLSLLFFSLVFVSTSCKKDKEEPKNEFTYNGTTYTLSKGFIEEFGDNGNGSFDWDVTLASSGISFSNANGTFSGTGDLLYLDLNTSSADGLVAGTYTFSSTRDVLTFVDGIIGLDFDASTSSGTTVNVTGGTVEIELNGSQVTITFDLTTATGSITGNYSGALTTI